jgi:hypothetical protein
LLLATIRKRQRVKHFTISESYLVGAFSSTAQPPPLTDAPQDGFAYSMSIRSSSSDLGREADTRKLFLRQAQDIRLLADFSKLHSSYSVEDHERNLSESEDEVEWSGCRESVTSLFSDE